MLLAVKRYFMLMFLVAQTVLSIFTITGLFGGDVNPLIGMFRAMLAYALPILIAANLLFLIVWLVRRKWILSAIPVLTILLCIPYIGTLYQLRPAPEDTSTDGLRVATYNVHGFSGETSGFMAGDILAQMRQQRVDVLCMQEYSDLSGDQKNSERYKEYFPYMAKGMDDMVIYSRYPIAGQRTIEFEQTTNSAMWADVRWKGKTLRVFNVHMETTGFNRALHVVGKEEFDSQSKRESRLVKAIYQGYTIGMVIRAGQANLVANEIHLADKPVIVCGDFNDVPYSYTYNTIRGELSDGFKQAGSGWHYTFRGRKAVRIDYIMQSDCLESRAYYTMPITYSDHYPVVSTLAWTGGR